MARGYEHHQRDSRAKQVGELCGKAKLGYIALLNRTLLAQALRFKNQTPSNKQIEALYKSARDYQKSNELYFLDLKYGQRPKITNEQLFFEFLSYESGLTIDSFEDIEPLLEQSVSRKESVEKSGNSKNSYTKVFEKVLLFQQGDNRPKLYVDYSEIVVEGEILAVENAETFLNIYPIMSHFGFKNFLYLGGFPNKLTQAFLRDKDVVFFLDYDIEAIRIYDSIRCEKKSFFKHPDIQYYFQQQSDKDKTLYLKQRKALPTEHSELDWLLQLIRDYSVVVEQEIFD